MKQLGFVIGGLIGLAGAVLGYALGGLTGEVVGIVVMMPVAGLAGFYIGAHR